MGISPLRLHRPRCEAQGEALRLQWLAYRAGAGTRAMPTCTETRGRNSSYQAPDHRCRARRHSGTPLRTHYATPLYFVIAPNASAYVPVSRATESNRVGASNKATDAGIAVV